MAQKPSKTAEWEQKFLEEAERHIQAINQLLVQLCTMRLHKRDIELTIERQKWQVLTSYTWEGKNAPERNAELMLFLEGTTLWEQSQSALRKVELDIAQAEADLDTRQRRYELCTVMLQV